jgi:hypothetical protein
VGALLSLSRETANLSYAKQTDVMKKILERRASANLVQTKIKAAEFAERGALTACGNDE